MTVESNPYIDYNMTTATEQQVGGNHYMMPIQPIDFIVKNDIPFREANIVKYAVRHKKKNKDQDVAKCLHYAQMILEETYGHNVEIKINGKSLSEFARSSDK